MGLQVGPTRKCSHDKLAPMLSKEGPYIYIYIICKHLIVGPTEWSIQMDNIWELPLIAAPIRMDWTTGLTMHLFLMVQSCRLLIKGLGRLISPVTIHQ